MNAVMWLVLVFALSVFAAVNSQTCSVSQTGQIRLSKTSTVNLNNSGRVEICIGGVWGTIAADSVAIPWSEKNAQVACIELGYSGALNSIFQRTLPFIERSTAPIHLTSVSCSGSENNIIDCPHSNSTGSVDHGYDAFIVCRPSSFSYSVAHPSDSPQSGDIRLFGDTRNGYGAVQIYTVTLGWQGICPDSSWTNSDAATICQDLGYQSGTIATPVTSVRGPGGVASRLLYAANCPGRSNDDISTGVCSFRVQSSSSSCAFAEGIYATVQCSLASDQSVRLIGGSHSREGIVEITFNGRWGMVCNQDFSVVDAQSICRGLGYGTDDTSVRSSSSSFLAAESNLRPIWLTNLDCTSSDRNLPSCVREQNIIGYANCHSRSIAAVDCGDPPPLTPGQIAGIVIGVLAFLAIVIPLLVICLDENKKKATLAKLHSCRTRMSNVQMPRPKCTCTCTCKLPRRQFRPAPQQQSTPQQEAPPQPPAPQQPPLQPTPQQPAPQQAAPKQPVTEQPPPGPPFPEPQASAPEVPPMSKAAEAGAYDDLPPPYPGGPGPAYLPPGQYTAPISYNSYPPAWSDAAYPPASGVNNSAPYPD